MQNEYLAMALIPPDGYSYQNSGGDNPAAVVKGKKWSANGKEQYSKSPWMSMG